MFTGLIRHQGQLADIQHSDSGAVLNIRYWNAAIANVQVGDSIAVNGCCLTALQPDDNGFKADLSSETLRLTTLGQLSIGARLNLEPSLRVGDALDGHLVSGHVDGVGRLRQRMPVGKNAEDGVILWFDAPKDCLPLIATKGSICIDGISLTVNDVDATGFKVQIIPHTLTVTSLGQLRIGDHVNLEVDMLARYVARLLTASINQ